METSNRNYGTRAIFGLILIVVGVLFLLKSLDYIYFNIPHVIFSGAFITFVIGLLILLNSRKKILGGIITLIGALWLMPRVFPNVDIDGGIILSVAIIGLGLYIIFKHKSSYPVNTSSEPNSGSASGTSYKSDSSSDYSIRKDYIDEVAIFGGGERIVHSDSFRGGSLTAVFGGLEVNLTTCKLANGVNTIDVLAMFGGAEIHVPRDWNVIVNATPIFGGFSNKIQRDPNMPIDTSKTLLIKGLAMFGGIEINSKYH